MLLQRHHPGRFLVTHRKPCREVLLNHIAHSARILCQISNAKATLRQFLADDVALVQLRFQTKRYDLLAFHLIGLVFCTIEFL